MLSSREDKSEVSQELREDNGAELVDLSHELSQLNSDIVNEFLHQKTDAENIKDIYENQQVYARNGTNFTIRLYDTGQLALSVKTETVKSAQSRQSEFESEEISDSKNSNYSSIIFNRKIKRLQDTTKNSRNQKNNCSSVGLTNELLSFVDQIEKLFLVNENFKSDINELKSRTKQITTAAFHRFFDHSFHFSDLFKFLGNEARKAIIGDNIDCYDIKQGSVKARSQGLLIEPENILAYQGYVAKVQGYSRDLEHAALIGIKISLLNPQEYFSSNLKVNSDLASSANSVFEIKLERRLERGLDIEVKHLPKLDTTAESELLNSYSDRAIFLKVEPDLFNNLLNNITLYLNVASLNPEINQPNNLPTGVISASTIYEIKNHFSNAIKFLNSPSDWFQTSDDSEIIELVKNVDQNYAVRVDSSMSRLKLYRKLIPKNIESEVSAFLAILELGVADLKFAAELCYPLGFDLLAQKYALATSVDFAFARKNMNVFMDKLLGIDDLKNHSKNSMISLVDDRMEDLQDRYLEKLEVIQEKHDLLAKNLSNEMLEDLELRKLLKSEKFKISCFEESMSRMLAGIGMNLRKELDKYNLKRSERAAIKNLVIDWSASEPVCTWINPKTNQSLGSPFKLSDNLCFVAKINAGLPNKSKKHFVELILPKIKSGALILPGLKLVSQDRDQRQTYERESAVVRL